MVRKNPTQAPTAPEAPHLNPLIKALQEARATFDGWENILTGIGLQGRDKRKSTTFTADTLSWQAAQDLWRGNDMASKIITKVPKEMLRRGYDVQIQGDDATGSKEQEEAIETKLTALCANEAFYDALCYKRAYGGGAILLGAQDGAANLKAPLNENNLQSIDFLTSLTAQELRAASWYTNPLAPNYGRPASFWLQPQGMASTNAVNVEIHESRLLLFQGVVTSRNQVQQNQGWGDSVLMRVNEALSDFNMTWGGVANLLQDFAQAIYKIKGLAQLVATNKDEVVLKRLQLIDLMRSVVRGVILDSDEDFERKTTSLAGIPEVLQQFILRLSGAAEMPVSLLMGQAPAGLNATGASDIRFFYDDVSGEQGTGLLPQATRLTRLLMRAKKGPAKGQEPKKWSIVFRPLWQMTEQEREDLRLKVAQRDNIYLSTGVLSSEEVAESRFGGDAWSAETVIDLDARRRTSQAPAQEPPQPDPKKDAARLDAGRGGVMVALYPPRDVALDLVVPGGEPSYELHLTLCYLGPIEGWTSEQIMALQQAIASVAARAPVVEGTIAGVGRFPASSSTGGMDVLWAAVDALNLPRLREALVSAIEGARLPYSQAHSFQPHITLAYLSPDEESPIARLAPRSVRFGSMVLIYGESRISYVLGGAS